jgi:hypothetical protein
MVVLIEKINCEPCDNSFGSALIGCLFIIMFNKILVTYEHTCSNKRMIKMELLLQILIRTYLDWI